MASKPPTRQQEMRGVEPLDRSDPLITPPIRYPWDRRPKEGDESWIYFQYFRDMGVSRSIGAVARDFSKDERTMFKLSSIHEWRIRAVAWDAQIDRAKQEGYLEEARLMGQRHAKLGMKMQGLGEVRIEAFVNSEELRATMTARDALSMVQTGVQIEREARGEDKGAKIEDTTIIFNFGTMAAPPSWAPKTLKLKPPDDPEMIETIETIETIDAEIVEGPDADDSHT